MPETEQSFRNTLPHHVGIVVRDIEKAIAHLEALGFGPFKFDDEHKVFAIEFKGELHGRPAEWTTKISNAKMGPVELELGTYEATGPQGDLDAQGEACTTIGG